MERAHHPVAVGVQIGTVRRDERHKVDLATALRIGYPDILDVG
jgi:hypothetical protein